MMNFNISGTVTMTSSLLIPRIAALATCGIETIGIADLLKHNKLYFINYCLNIINNKYFNFLYDYISY